MKWVDLWDDDPAVENVNRALREPARSGFAPTWRSPEAPDSPQDGPRGSRAAVPASQPRLTVREAVAGLIARIRAGDHFARSELARLIAPEPPDEP